ncbi:MAG: dTMP kinase [Candidatus Omnitrophica bacterium]|nr:dTMP kinase [Candidatus Omnitrophota bacterium]
MRGKFITFEGSEGCGKSTQSRMLSRYLKGRGCKVVYIREPGGTKISEKIREILLNPKNKKISTNCEMLLYMAARVQIVEEVIRPALLDGKIVICDRFLDSTVVYQGFGLGIDIQLIKKVGIFATGGLKPHLTILLDLPVRDGLKKRGSSKDRIERRPYSYHLRVRKGYLKLAAQETNRIKVIKVENNKNKTQNKIREAVEKYVF